MAAMRSSRPFAAATGVCMVGAPGRIPPQPRLPPLRFHQMQPQTRREIVSVISGLMLAVFLAGLDQTIVATSLSTMARDLDGWRLMPWVVSAYLVSSTTVTPLYGRLSDLF